MIAPLRRRHRWTTAVLAVAVPVLYVVALAARPDEPVVVSLPPEWSPAPAGKVEADLGLLIEDPPVVVRARGDGSSDVKSWGLELEPIEPIARPKMLVYWSASPPTAGRLPEAATLLGGLAGRHARTFELPVAARGHAGTLVLYSLGHQEIVASAPLPAIGVAPAAESAVDAGAESAESDRPETEATP